MKNIEFKKIYWESDKIKRNEIISTLLKRKNKQFRVKQGNIDFLINLIEPFNDKDIKVAIMINGIYTLDELKEKCIYLE